MVRDVATPEVAGIYSDTKLGLVCLRGLHERMVESSRGGVVARWVALARHPTRD